MTTKTVPGRFEVYEVFDDEGHPVGRIVLPTQTPRFGSAEGTVYLRRAPIVWPLSPRAA